MYPVVPNFTLLHDSVLVEPEQITETSGGVLIPENHKERPVIGVVVADCGETIYVAGALGSSGNVRVPMPPGTRVLFSRFAGAIVERDTLSRLTGEEYEKDLLLLNFSDIRMVFPFPSAGLEEADRG